MYTAHHQKDQDTCEKGLIAKSEGEVMMCNSVTYNSVRTTASTRIMMVQHSDNIVHMLWE